MAQGVLASLLANPSCCRRGLWEGLQSMRKTAHMWLWEADVLGEGVPESRGSTQVQVTIHATNTPAVLPEHSLSPGFRGCGAELRTGG